MKHRSLWVSPCPLTSRRSQSPLALSVPLSRFTPRVGGGSAFFVRRHRALYDYRKTWPELYGQVCFAVVARLVGIYAIEFGCGHTLEAGAQVTWGFLVLFFTHRASGWLCFVVFAHTDEVSVSTMSVKIREIFQQASIRLSVFLSKMQDCLEDRHTRFARYVSIMILPPNKSRACVKTSG